MLPGLEKLDKFLTPDSSKPTDIESIYYLFWKRGISLKEFNELPIPYIFGIIKTQTYINKEEEKAYKKSKRK